MSWPSSLRTDAESPLQSLRAFLAMVSKTGWTSVCDRLMTRKISLVAVRADVRDVNGLACQNRSASRALHARRHRKHSVKGIVGLGARIVERFKVHQFPIVRNNLRTTRFTQPASVPGDRVKDRPDIR